MDYSINYKKIYIFFNYLLFDSVTITSDPGIFFVATPCLDGSARLFQDSLLGQGGDME
jgi:hypothetical protein